MAIVISTISVPWISRMDSFTPYLSITLLTPILLEQGHFRQRAKTIIDKLFQYLLTHGYPGEITFVALLGPFLITASPCL
jgi:hypothetical protein